VVGLGVAGPACDHYISTFERLLGVSFGQDDRRALEEMRAAGMKTALTIARALSYPINATLARAGYAWGGTLVNNTNICGGFESMNVWYRALER
jgi:hypothetical protein